MVTQYIFAWDDGGVQAIVPIHSLRDWNSTASFRRLSGLSVGPNPLEDIIHCVIWRGRDRPGYTVVCYTDPNSGSPAQWSRVLHTDLDALTPVLLSRGMLLWEKSSGQTHLEVDKLARYVYSVHCNERQRA